MNESVLYIVLQREIFIEHFVNIFVDVKKKNNSNSNKNRHLDLIPCCNLLISGGVKIFMTYDI